MSTFGLLGVMCDNVISRKVLYGIFGLFCYFVYLAFYRLYLSPLSAIPGPRLAALTSLYAMYYDIYCGGQYIWVVEEMHKKYGSVVRIRPDAIHFNNAKFLEQVYGVAGSRRDKSKLHCNSLMVPKAFVSTSNHDLHRRRRAPMNSYFSKNKIRDLEPILQETLVKVLAKMQESAAAGIPIELRPLFNAATSDIITEYAFGECWNSLDAADLNNEFFNALNSGGQMWHVSSYFPWVIAVIPSLPIQVATWLVPRMKLMIPLFGALRNNIERTRVLEKEQNKTSFLIRAVLDSNLPETEKSTERLLRESQVLIAAGTETTSMMLSKTIFHLISSPKDMEKLKLELKTAIPDPTITPSSLQLENLPYLNAVIHETLRLHPPGSMRQERIAPDEDLVFKDQDREHQIPRGTIMAMTATLLSRSEQLYPNPYEWRPQRFIENPRLVKDSLAFSRGTRVCIGINLAYAELYIILAAIIRKYDLYNGSGDQKGPTLELFQTTREDDVDVYADFATPCARKILPGIRIMVREP